MQTIDLLTEIGRLFPGGESVQILAALRKDPLVWGSLQKEDFLQAALSGAGSQVLYWSPGYLAMLSLSGVEPQNLRAEPLTSLDGALQENVLRAYQYAQGTATIPGGLAEAGLLALALRERRRLTGAWSGLLKELLPKPNQAETASAIWRTPLACLYSLVPDPEDMLRELAVKTKLQVPLEWLAHVVVSQPLGANEQTQILTRVLKQLPVEVQLGVLRSLSLHGSEDLARSVASQLVIGHPAFANVRVQHGSDKTGPSHLSERALSLQQMGTFYQLAGDPEQALSLLTATEEVLGQWAAGLYLQRFNLHTQESGQEATLPDPQWLSRLADMAEWMDQDLGVVLASHPNPSCILDQVSPVDENGFLQLRRAHMLFKSDPPVARDLAHQGVQTLLADVRQRGIPFNGAYVFMWQPGESIKILCDLGLLDEALRLAEAFIALRPTDVRLLDQAGAIMEQLGHIDQAVCAAQNVAALAPDVADWRRILAARLGKAGQWAQSFEEWQKVLVLSETKSLRDRLACAESGLRAGQHTRAVDICETVLQQEPNHGAALGLMGQALISQGEMQQAMSYLVRATLLAPEELSSWLTLAQVQHELEGPQRAMETLRSAVAAVPEAADGYLALGQACLSAGLLAEAAPHLKKALQLSKGSGAAALSYGRVLRLLGHTDEARQVLEQARPDWKANPELAYEYAQVLLDLNDADSALHILEAALQNGRLPVDAHLLYAKILLGEYQSGNQMWDAEVSQSRMMQADQALRRILEMVPDSLEGRFLMADILREKGELEDALELYRALAETPAASDPELSWRVQSGLSRTAMRLGQTDLALAALREAVQVKPGSLQLQRGLAEASLRANLADEALETANAALQLAPDDLENLIWFANLAFRLGETNKAVDALERAVQIDINRPDLRIRLAEGQMSAGDLAAARAGLEKVLDMDQSGQSELRQAGQLYMRMEDRPAALECFNRALIADSDAPADMLFEIARLHAQMGNLEASLTLTQRVLDEDPDNLPTFLFQTDLLGRLNRPQAALALLERALRIVQAGGEDSLPAGEHLGEIHQRFTNLLYAEGDLAAALYHAEKALALNPDRAGLLYKAADLALALLQNEQAGRILDQAMPKDPGSLSSFLDQQGRDGLDLLCLQIEFALANEQIENARAWVGAGLEREPESARLLSAMARVLAREGDIRASDGMYDLAIAAAKKEHPDDSDAGLLWQAQAALEVQRWQDSLALFKSYVQRRPGEARAHLALARFLVLAAERQRLCAAAGCRFHAPGPQFLDEDHQTAFDEAIRSTVRLASSGELTRWQVRGQAVFNPSIQASKALAALPACVEDTAALVATLRQLNNRTAAIQVAQRSMKEASVLIQLALCYLGKDAREGVEIAEQSVWAEPMNPLAQAVLAKLAGQAGDLQKSLRAYSEALKIWANEPEWHDAAGDLCIRTDQLARAIEHRSQAAALVPHRAAFAFKLGQACLSQADTAEAIEHLEKATMLDVQMTEAWLALATAYYMVGQLPQALEAAKLASELAPSTSEGLLIAGETALAMGQIDLALEFGQSASRREPEKPDAFLFLSNVWVLKNRPVEGLNMLEHASPAIRNNYPVAFERACLIHKVHGARPALEVLEKLAKDYPEEPGLIGYLARVQAECGELKQAERNALKALRLDPEQPDLALMLGQLQRKSGQLDQAVYLLGESIRLAPDHLESYLELASVHQERREYDQALEIYRQAMRIAPNDYQAYYQSGLILRDSKDYSGAETMLRRAADLASDNLTIRRQLVAVIAMNLVHSKQEVMS